MGNSATPAIILVEPQLGENIGTAARAMMNCGLSELRLVNPRDGWPSKFAIAASSGAERILEEARLYDTTAGALEGLRHVYATTARPRDMNKPALGPREAGVAMRGAEAAGERNGILFGKESKGLHNDDIVLAGTIIEARLNPAHTSLNLAQAVLLVGWEWWMAGPVETPAAKPEAAFRKADAPALQSDLLNMFEHLESALDDAMRKALLRAYPELADMRLTDYKVRILTPQEGTAAVTRVMVESTDGSGLRWSTVGISPNIIEASYEALRDAIYWKLLRHADSRRTDGRPTDGQ